MRSEGRPHPNPLLSFDLLRIKKERELDKQSLNAHPFLKEVQECRSDALLRSVDVCLTSNRSTLTFNVHPI